MQVEILDITRNENFERHLYRCLAPMPFRKYKQRQEYLDKAIGKGFHKKILILDRKIVGQIEYAPAKVSGYPISGYNVIVMNCIWVLRKAKGYSLGKQLLKNMIENEKNADGFATIALENHWSPWFMKWQMKKLGFKPLDEIKVTHKKKHEGQIFSIYLMWMPLKEDAKPPVWNKQKGLEGVTFCMAHPLYSPQTWKGNILETK